MFIGDKYAKWVEEKPDPDSRDRYMKSILADIFLKGNSESPHLKNSFTYVRSFKDHEYIRAAYQATTKPFIWKQIKENGDNYREAYARDEFNMIYIGS